MLIFSKNFLAQSSRKNTNPGKESGEAHEKILLAVEQRDVAAEKAVEDSMEVWEYLVFKQ